jgi:hypothetical protein
VKKLVFWSVLALVMATAPATVWAGGQSEIVQIRIATARYHRVEVAEADGFVQFYGCIQSLPDGAMGVHYVHPDRFDGQLNLLEPEVLVYAIEPNGEQKLAAVEYIIPAAFWPGDAPPPEFLGQELRYKTTMGPHELDPYYEVHVWAWRHNPNGLFADWNPKVTCSNPD